MVPRVPPPSRLGQSRRKCGSPGQSPAPPSAGLLQRCSAAEASLARCATGGFGPFSCSRRRAPSSRLCGTTRMRRQATAPSPSSSSSGSAGSPGCSRRRRRGICSTITTTTGCSSPSGRSSPGACTAAAAYWVFGGILQVVLNRLGSLGSYRRTRHLLAFACVPIVLSLLLWPVKLSLYGSALFHRGGSDSGTGGEVFALLQLVFLAWAAGLLVPASGSCTAGRGSAPARRSSSLWPRRRF